MNYISFSKGAEEYLDYTNRAVDFNETASVVFRLFTRSTACTFFYHLLK